MTAVELDKSVFRTSYNKFIKMIHNLSQDIMLLISHKVALLMSKVKSENNERYHVQAASTRHKFSEGNH